MLRTHSVSIHDQARIMEGEEVKGRPGHGDAASRLAIPMIKISKCEYTGCFGANQTWVSCWVPCNYASCSIFISCFCTQYTLPAPQHLTCNNWSGMSFVLPVWHRQTRIDSLRDWCTKLNILALFDSSWASTWRGSNRQNSKPLYHRFSQACILEAGGG